MEVNTAEEMQVIQSAPAPELGGDRRALAVAKFLELADRLESGELDGARVSWRDYLLELISVEVDRRNGQVRLITEVFADKGTAKPVLKVVR
jgi:hypothetical protein